MTKLIVIAGDSWAVGFGMTAASLPGYLAVPNPAAYVFGGTYWGALRPGVNTGTPTNPQAWSVEAQIAYRFGLDHPGEPLLIVKNPGTVKGSTPLANEPGALDWNPASVGEMFDTTDATIDAARAAFTAATGEQAPEVSAVFFLSGGANDAVSADRAAAHETNLTDEFAAIRAEWMDDAEGYIGFTRIHDNPALPYNFPVRVSQWAVDQADVNAESVKTVGLEMLPDGIHPTAPTIITIANGLYDNWAF